MYQKIARPWKRYMYRFFEWTRNNLEKSSRYLNAIKESLKSIRLFTTFFLSFQIKQNRWQVPVTLTDGSATFISLKLTVKQIDFYE